MKSLTPLFSPHSVAVIGASRSNEKLGHAVLLNLLEFKFKGKIYPVNPNAKQILGLKCYPNISSIGKVIDLTIIAVPATIVPAIIQECVDNKARSIIVISAGFSEIGNEGKVLEDKIKSIIRKSESRFLGPNCLGIINSESNLNATFAINMPNEGNISFMSQSGAFGTAALDWASEKNVGFCNFVSLGNKADLNESDILEYWQGDPKTKVIGIYLESILDGKKFIELGYETSKEKPLVILKPGRSLISKKAISSHTGSLAGEDSVIDAALKKGGFIRVSGPRELYNLLKAFSWQPLPAGEKVAVISNAGGPAVITTDLISELDLDLAKFSKKTKTRLTKILPKIVNVQNPLDIVGDALSDRYRESIETVVKDKSVQSVVVILTPQRMTEIEKTADAISEIASKTKKTILATFMGGMTIKKAEEILQKSKVPTYRHPESAIKTLVEMVKYRKWKEMHKESRISIRMPNLSKSNKRNKGIINSILKKASQNATSVVSVEDSIDILSTYNINFPEYKIIYTKEKLIDAVEDLGFPVVMKLPVESAIHKVDVGGVKANIRNGQDLIEAYDELREAMGSSISENMKIHLQKFISGGQEVMIGVKKDPSFGNILVFGFGGIYTELFKDISRRILPINKDEIFKMIKETKVYKILSGYRGKSERDIKALINMIYNVSKFSLDYPEVTAIDINPAIVLDEGKGCSAVDVKIFV